MLPGRPGAPGSAHAAPSALPPVAQARVLHQGADSGPAGAGAVPEHSSPGPADVGAGTPPRDGGGGGDCAGGSGARAG